VLDTGIKLGLSACREFMHKHLGMKCRKMATIPSKADPERQEVFLEHDLKPLLDEEKKGKALYSLWMLLILSWALF